MLISFSSSPWVSEPGQCDARPTVTFPAAEHHRLPLSPDSRHLWDSCKSGEFIGKEGVQRRPHMLCILKVYIKAYNFARDACIRHTLNERASAWNFVGPNFVRKKPRFWIPQMQKPGAVYAFESSRYSR